MTRRLRAQLAIAVTTAALGATACGSTSTPTSPGKGATSAASTSSVATKAAFVAAAEGICHGLSLQEKPLKAQAESLQAGADKAFVSVADRVLTLSRAAERQLRALPRPPDASGKIENLLSIYDGQLTYISTIAHAVALQEKSTGEAATAALRKSAATHGALAREFGLKGCFGSE